MTAKGAAIQQLLLSNDSANKQVSMATTAQQQWNSVFCVVSAKIL
jgi:hypothetical protein